MPKTSLPRRPAAGDDPRRVLDRDVRGAGHPLGDRARARSTASTRSTPRHVADLSVQLFRELQPEHQLDPRHELLLRGRRPAARGRRVRQQPQPPQALDVPDPEQRPVRPDPRGHGAGRAGRALPPARPARARRTRSTRRWTATAASPCPSWRPSCAWPTRWTATTSSRSRDLSFARERGPVRHHRPQRRGPDARAAGPEGEGRDVRGGLRHARWCSQEDRGARPEERPMPLSPSASSTAS